MNKKSIILVILVIVAVTIWAFVLAGRRHARTLLLDRSTIVQANPYRCQSCGEQFTMTFDEMRQHIKEGRVVSPPNQWRRFPCPKCNEINAVILDEKYGPTTPQQQPAN